MNLIAEREHGVEEEQHPVHNGQRTLGDGQPATFGLEATFPGLQDEDTGRDEHGAPDQAEEDVDLFVDGVAHHVTGKQANQDDAETDEGSGNEHNGQLIGFTQTFVVQGHAADGDGQFQELDEGQSTDGHFWWFVLFLRKPKNRVNSKNITKSLHLIQQMVPLLKAAVGVEHSVVDALLL